MGVMMRRVPGTAQWQVFKDGSKVGAAYQSPDGTWYADPGGLGSPIQAPTRREAARTLTGAF